MVSEEQKRIWQKEKEQQLRDKQNAGREVRYNKVNLKFAGGAMKEKSSRPAGKRPINIPPDELLRRQLGIDFNA